jgi:hypothetical protein
MRSDGLLKHLAICLTILRQIVGCRKIEVDNYRMFAID